MRDTLQVAGRAILFATLINAGGFLALMLAELPPMREFGLLAALAFLLSMLADFTALPAALWILFRARPDADRRPIAGQRARLLNPTLELRLVVRATPRTPKLSRNLALRADGLVWQDWAAKG